MGHMVTIRRYRPKDFEASITLRQQVFSATYVDEEHGIPAELFSMENFKIPPMQAHFKETMRNSADNAGWVAELEGKIIGSISVTYHPGYDEVHGFYVDVSQQGKGIGTQLWDEMLTFRRSRKISVDVFEHAHKTIAMYKQWGFRRPLFHRHGYIHWDGWPSGYVLRTVNMYKQYAE